MFILSLFNLTIFPDSSLYCYSQSSPSLNIVKSQSQSLTPIIKQIRSTTSQGSPSRVRFNAVTNVYLRESSDSSDKDDTTDDNKFSSDNAQNTARFGTDDSTETSGDEEENAMDEVISNII